MDTSRLSPILNKESILKTANARELGQSPQDVLERYHVYAHTHVPLGDTDRQLISLRRVITENKTCAVGTIVGPYGYGKTSTAVHLWHELREKKIMAVPPFVWVNLSELLDAVYHWVHFELSQGPKAFLGELDTTYAKYRRRSMDELSLKLGAETFQELLTQGRLVLEIRPDDVLGFYSDVCAMCERAGYAGMAVFTDELQVTVAEYKPSRDQFFNDLFQIVAGILGRPGYWALIVSMNDDTEATISRLRADLLQRMQHSALYFRVRDMYNRRDYPAELWAAYEKRFGFDGSSVVTADTLEAIGQVAARSDLGAGPRMVTNALSIAIRHYEKSGQPYTPIQFVDDFLAGLMVFDQRGKFVTAVRKALDNPSVKASEAHQRVVKLLAAYPMGCEDSTLEKYDLARSLRSFPALARRELVAQQSGGYILRFLAEEDEPEEQIELRLTKEFVSRFSPGKTYAAHAADGFMSQVLVSAAFNGWEAEKRKPVDVGSVRYQSVVFKGQFENRFPDRKVHVLVTALPQSQAPIWKRADPDIDLELRFELNYGLGPGEPNRILVAPERPEIAIFQLNIGGVYVDAANRIVPNYLHAFYSADQLTPWLCLALMDYLYSNRGELPDDQNRVNMALAPLRQYILTVLLNESMQTTPADFANTSVGTERVKDVFRTQCRVLYPLYKTLITSPRTWQQNLQAYNYAVQKVVADEGVSVARGRASWVSTKNGVADAFKIPGRRLTNLETLLDVLSDLILKEEFSGRGPDSEVKLRFKLHPLEQEWLAKMDTATEKVKRDGVEVPGLPANDLLWEAKKNGYTEFEVQEVMRLLVSRKYVDYDAKRSLLVRTVDNIEDLRAAILEHVDTIEKQIQELAQALPDYNAGLIPVSKLRKSATDAKERDELEAVNAEWRKHKSGLDAFAESRLTTLKVKLAEDQSTLFARVHQGVPPWLAREFNQGPLQDLLEKQRKDLAAAYEATLAEMRRVREESVRQAQALTGSTSELLTQTFTLLQALQKSSAMLNTRVQSFADRQDDLEAWHRVSDGAAELNHLAATASETYGNGEFKAAIDKFWVDVRARFERQALTSLGEHAAVAKQVEDHKTRVAHWLQGRRDDFERQCREYEQVMAPAGINERFKVPFDQEHPNESHEALFAQADQAIARRRQALQGRLSDLLQTARYGRLVQGLSLGKMEQSAQQLQQRADALAAAQTKDVVRNLQALRENVLAPLAALAGDEETLRSELQKAVRKQPPTEAEQRVLDQLCASMNSGALVDLRGLILQQLKQGDAQVDMDALMRDLRALFQKNQIAIYVEVTGSEKKR